MRVSMKNRVSQGFTLLEVLLATSIMAVGTTSVLVVIATAAGMASQRQVNVRREQVLDEARHDAQTMVDAFIPSKPTGPQVIASRKGGSKNEPATKIAPDNVDGKRSGRFDGFVYDLAFAPKDRAVPEKGFDVGITVHYGGGELSMSTTTSVISTTIPDEEFTTSTTYDEQKSSPTGGSKPRESR